MQPHFVIWVVLLFKFIWRFVFRFLVAVHMFIFSCCRKWNLFAFFFLHELYLFTVSCFTFSSLFVDFNRKIQPHSIKFNDKVVFCVPYADSYSSISRPYAFATYGQPTKRPLNWCFDTSMLPIHIPMPLTYLQIVKMQRWFNFIMKTIVLNGYSRSNTTKRNNFEHLTELRILDAVKWSGRSIQ